MGIAVSLGATPISFYLVESLGASAAVVNTFQRAAPKPSLSLSVSVRLSVSDSVSQSLSLPLSVSLSLSLSLSLALSPKEKGGWRFVFFAHT